MDFKEFRKVRIRVDVPALELARRAKIDRSRISLYESGTVVLSEKQIDNLHNALAGAIRFRLSSFASALKTLTMSNKNSVKSVGARSLNGDGEPDAPGVDR